MAALNQSEENDTIYQDISVVCPCQLFTTFLERNGPYGIRIFLYKKNNSISTITIKIEEGCQPLLEKIFFFVSSIFN